MKHLLIAAAGMIVFTFKAEAADFIVEWRGDADPFYYNSGRVLATISIDTAAIPNPGTYNQASTMPAWIGTITMQATGTISALFREYDYSGVYFDAPFALDFSRELVGQTSGGQTWGPGGVGNFGLQQNGSGAPTQWGPGNPLPFYLSFTSRYMQLVSFAPVSLPPSIYITTTIDQTDSRVTGGGSLNFQGGTLLPTGAGTLNLTNNIDVITASSGTIDASNRNISASGNVDIQGNNLTLKGTSSSTITLSGAISGTGIIVNESGNNILSGTNTSGGTLVSGGTLRINSTSSLPASNNLATNGSIILPNGNPGSKTYGQSFSLNGNGATGQGALILGTTDSSGSLVLNGQITLTGNSTVMTDGAGTGTQTIAGVISGSTSGLGLSVVNASGSNAILTSAIGSNISSVTKSGAGTFTISGGSVSGNFTITGGLVTLNNVNGLSTTSINTVNGGTLELSNGGGAGNAFAQNFVIAGTGSNGASLSLGTASTTGSLTLSGNIAASANATIRTVGNGTMTATINGNLNAGSYAITLDTTTGSNLVIASQLTANSVNKTSAGNLTLNNAAVISAPLSVSSGIFTNNGTINGNIAMATGTTLKGSGVINGQVANSGTVAPGNSPGIISVNGSYTSLTGSTYQAEIGGLGGPGNASGHDRIVVTGSPGTFTIQGGAGLAALKLNAFEASRGNVFNIYSATGGITGTFNSFTSQFSRWMLLDRATGNIYGTGLTPSQDLSVFLTKFGNTLWNTAVTIKSNDVINGYTGIIDSTTPWGKAVVDVLLGASSIPGSLDPTPYASVTQTETFLMRQGMSALYGQMETWRHEAIMHDSLTQGFVIGTGAKYTGGSTASFDLSQSGVLAGVMHALNESCVLGFMGQSASTKSTFASGAGEAHGNAYNVGGFFSATTGKGFDSYFINAGFVLGRSDSKATRNTFFGAQTSTPSSESKGVFVRIGRDIRNMDGFAMVPYVGIDHSNVHAKSFGETGDATALNVSGFDYSSTRLSAGAGINWFKVNTDGSAIRFAVDLEGFAEVGSGKEVSITSNFAGDTPFQTKVTLGSGNGFALRPSINYDTAGRSSYSLSLGYENSGTSKSIELQAGYRFRF